MARRTLKVARNLSFVRSLRWVLWGLLALSVLLTVLGPPTWLVRDVDTGRLSRLVLLGPTVLFSVFVVAFAVYRFALVRAGRYNAGKAFLQVGLSALVLLFMVPQGLQRYREAGGEALTPVDLSPVLGSPDPLARVAACEAIAARRGDPDARALARQHADDDPDARVRAACARVR